MGPEDWAAFEDGFGRHVHTLGFVPPEFRNHGRFGLDDPPSSTKFPLSPLELQSIEEAGTLAHRKAITYAEAARERGGYGGLGPDVKVPDQRHLLTDNDPQD